MSGQNISLPRVTYTNVPAQVAISNAPQRVLLVGYQQAAGGQAGQLVSNISNDNSHRAAFGRSMLTQMIDAYKEHNQETVVDVIPLAPPSGTQAVYTLTVTGTATDAGEIEINPESARNRVRVSVASGSTATQIAAAIQAAYAAKMTSGLLDAAVDDTDDNIVNLTAVSAGDFANDIGMKLTVNVAGVTVALAQETQGGGAVDTTGVLDVIGNQRYQTIVWPFPDDLDEVINLLDSRFNVENDVLDGVSISVHLDTLANNLSHVNPLNSESHVCIANALISEPARTGGGILENPWVIGSAFGALRALRLTEDALLTQYLTTVAARDQFGGPALASLPYFNTSLPLFKVMETGLGYTDQEVQQLNAAGAMVIGNNQARNGVIIGEAITSYKTDVAGNPDPTFHFLNSVDQASVAREYMYNNTKKRFAQSRLTKGAVIDGRDMANEQVIRSFLVGLYGDLAGPDFVIVQDGPEFIQFFKDNLKVELDLVNGKVTVDAKICYMSQARQWIGTLQYTFDIEG